MSGRRLTTAAALALLRQRRGPCMAASTVTLEQRALARLLPRLGRALGAATRADLERLLAARRAEVAPATVARELTALRALYRLLVDEGLVRHDPTRGLRVAPAAQRRLLLSEESVSRLLAAASDSASGAARSSAVRVAVALRDRAALELLYGLGLRAGEACAAALLDLDLAGRSLLVRRTKGRGGLARLPVPAAAVPQLVAYVAQGRPALLREDDCSEGRLLVTERGGPLAASYLGRRVQGLGARVGVEVHPHALRRSLATHLVRRGAALPAVQRLLGHVALDTTQRYVAVDVQELRAAVEALEPGPRALAGEAGRAAAPGVVTRSPASPAEASQ
ncbi:MAG: tyrosine-type recombinase/integrase [Planctomycetota bacterium]